MAQWKPDEFQQNLEAALGEYDRERCANLCNDLISYLRSAVKPYESTHAENVLLALRRKRYFDLMSRTADAFLRSGLTTPKVRRLYAQSLLDQGHVSAGLSVLNSIITEPDVSRSEQAEAQGLIGRAYKQIYMDAGDSRPFHNQAVLTKAIDAYYQICKQAPDKYLWHGVCAMALLARAHRDGVRTNVPEGAEGIANSIVEIVGEDDARGADMWGLATLAEACVALGRWEAAAKYLRRYAETGSDAFELGSTLRQFQEVWQLDAEEGPERALMDLLRSKLLERSGGTITASPDNVAKIIDKSKEPTPQLEKLLSETRYQSYRWMLQAMRNARCVGRVWQAGNGVGTGFLLPGEALSARLAGEQVFLSNNHVISNPRGHFLALLPEQAEITFDVVDGGSKRYKVETLLWQSPVAECDATVLRLNERVEGVEYYILASKMLPNRGKDRIYVIGHPRGGELSFSFQDNMLIDFNDRLIHYRSPTEPGSSGSPIFNGDWELIGLHHAGSDQLQKLDGSGTYPANEGIPLPAIWKDLAKG